jgi:hypothetical protein
MAPAGAVQKDPAETAESVISLMVDRRTRFFPQAMPRSHARARAWRQNPRKDHRFPRQCGSGDPADGNHPSSAYLPNVLLPRISAGQQAIHHRSLEAYAVSLLPSGRGNLPLQYNCCAVVVTMQEKRYPPCHQESSRNSSLADIFFVV